MKKLFENWNKFCKEGLNEVSPKQRVHDERVATQREERNVKDAEAQELQQILGDQWVVNLRRLEAALGRRRWARHRCRRRRPSWDLGSGLGD